MEKEREEKKNIIKVYKPVLPDVVDSVAASVHFTLQIAPVPAFLASEVKTTWMSPDEVILGFLVLQYLKLKEIKRLF